MQQKPEILIVEDQFVEANHLRLMLKRAGYPLRGIARSVQDALELIAVRPPGLVLLDIFLSGEGTGIDLAEKLREMQIPFIYLSANSNEDTLNAAKATQPYGFLVKPFREKDLLVTMAIARHHQESGLQSMMRKEALFRQQIKNLPQQCDHWEKGLLELIKAMQPLIPFDYVSAGCFPEEENNALAYLRIGFEEYQRIGNEELQTITRLKAHEIRRFKHAPPPDAGIILANGEEFRRRCRTATVEKLIADTFEMKAVLLLPVPLPISGRGHCLLYFFSRQSDGFTKEHLAICERLQESLIYAVEKLLPGNSNRPNARAVDPSITRASRKTSPAFEGVIGRSPLLLTVFDHVAQVAPAATSVLITGESGTGKESIAEAIHRLSPRSKSALIKVNCAALPGDLAESELFGHEKGAFTGATDLRIGRFEQANRGRPSYCAPYRSRRSNVSAPLPPSGSTPASSPLLTAIWKKKLRPAVSGSIYTTGSMSSPSTCRRCVSVPRTSSRLHNISWLSIAKRSANRSSISRIQRSNGSWPIRGREISASWKISSSEVCSSQKVIYWRRFPCPFRERRWSW